MPSILQNNTGPSVDPDAIAKTVAELTSQQDGVIRQQVIEQLMRQIMNYDAEFRREEATSAVGSNVKH